MHMASMDKGLNASAKAGAARDERAPGQGTRAAGRGARIALGALAFLLVGAAGGYLLATAQFKEQAAAISQAAQLRVDAANQRIEEVEQQQREIIQQADEQQREIMQQSSDQQRALLEQAKEKERKLAKPDLPVRVWLRKSFTGSGRAALAHNFGARELDLAVTARSGATGEQKSWRLVLAPNATQDLGVDQGWEFAPGDEIELAESRFRPMTVPVRPRDKPQPNVAIAR